MRIESDQEKEKSYDDHGGLIYCIAVSIDGRSNYPFGKFLNEYEWVFFELVLKLSTWDPNSSRSPKISKPCL